MKQETWEVPIFLLVAVAMLVGIAGPVRPALDALGSGIASLPGYVWVYVLAAMFAIGYAVAKRGHD